MTERATFDSDFKEEEPSQNAVVFNATGDRLATGGDDGIVRVWKVTGDAVEQVHAFAGHNKPVNGVSFNPSGSLVRRRPALPAGVHYMWCSARSCSRVLAAACAVAVPAAAVLLRRRHSEGLVPGGDRRRRSMHRYPWCRYVGRGAKHTCVAGFMACLG